VDEMIIETPWEGRFRSTSPSICWRRDRRLSVIGNAGENTYKNQPSVAAEKVELIYPILARRNKYERI
jgi:hypothetical protein